MKEEKILKESYRLFSEFWEKARNWKDEDGDNFLTWDKSVIGQFCFKAGKEQGKTSAINEVLKMIEELHNECKDRFCNGDLLEELKSQIESIK